ncbi:MAG: rhodanese-like domain-containing protein [Geminicoccaceae bacterium]
MIAQIAPAALRARLTESESEVALLDVREQGAFARGHILLASNAPISRLEIDAPRLVPRRSAAVVLCDGGDGVARRAAEALIRFGYREVAVLDGGVAGWSAAGFALFEGVYVPSKAFGEFVEAAWGTPHLSADELARLRADGQNVVVLDSRPMSEYRHMSIPGGIDVPGADLVQRIRDLAPDPDTLVVVNCAGRTRSIIGAQSLINAAIANQVAALANGTMGWSLAGYELEHDQARVPPPLSDAARAWAQQAAARVAARFGVRTIDHATLARFREEAEARTLYLCDVRAPEEYAAGHLPGALCTPGGQLVQATDACLGTRNARVVLVDDDGVRATMTASWLIQMGWRDAFVLRGGLCGDLELGPERTEVLGLDDGSIDAAVNPATLARMAEGDGVRILDLADSRAYRTGHIPGAWWVSRARLAHDLASVPPAPAHVLTSPDGILARLALAEVRRLVRAPVQVLADGTETWRAAGLPLSGGAEHLAGAEDDVYLRPYDRAPEQAPQAMRDYLRWETALVPQLERDGTIVFPSFRCTRCGTVREPR